jgi:hypothetical protein
METEEMIAHLLAEIRTNREKMRTGHEMMTEMRAW